MVREVFILLCCGAPLYSWLCAVSSPVVRAIGSLWRRGTSADAWIALSLAAGGAALWSAVLCGGVVLGMMVEPRAGLALLGSHAILPGTLLGAVVWGFQTLLTRRLPRFGPTFEAATAIGIVALINDDPRTLARVHRLYAAHAIDSAGGPAPASPGVAAIAA